MKASHMWRVRMVTDIPDSNREYWIHFVSREAIDGWLDDCPNQSRDGTSRRERVIRIEEPREKEEII